MQVSSLRHYSNGSSCCKVLKEWSTRHEMAKHGLFRPHPLNKHKLYVGPGFARTIPSRHVQTHLREKFERRGNFVSPHESYSLIRKVVLLWASGLSGSDS